MEWADLQEACHLVVSPHKEDLVLEALAAHLEDLAHQMDHLKDIQCKAVHPVEVPLQAIQAAILPEEAHPL